MHLEGDLERAAQHIEEIKRRGAKPLHVFTAYLLASLRDLGVINYGVVQRTTRHVGQKLALIYGRDSSAAEAIVRAAELLEVGRFEVLSGGESVIFRLKSNTCRICPKGVGELELPGRLCPLVGLLGGFSGAEAEEARREGGYCVIEFKV